MIYSLNGKIIEKTLNEVVIECGGVGYLVSVPVSASSAIPPIGEGCTIFTYMNISENDISLFGFTDIESQRMFKTLISVSGVGPKAGLAILSVMSAAKISLAVSAGDFKAFTAANGVGPKLAQRLVLELKDKVGAFKSSGISLDDVSAINSAVTGAPQAIQALVALGYSQSEAAQAISKLDQSLPTEEIIRLALRGMAR